MLPGRKLRDVTECVDPNTSLINGNDEKGCRFPVRYVLAVMSFTGFINVFTLRMDLNIAILSIADGDSSSNNSSSSSNTNMSSSRNVTMHELRKSWGLDQQNMVLSAFYYGYCSTQVIGGYLSGIFGGKRIMGLSMLVTSLVALVTPAAIMADYYLLIVCRVIQGLAQGFAQPCMHTFWSRWAPRQEKTKLMTFTLSGCQLGNIIATLVTGYLCEASPTLRWSLVFYVYGSAGFLWSVLWFLLVYDTPRQHPRISKQELEYIECNNEPVEKIPIKPPWCQLLINPAFLAIVTAQMANDWGCFALTTCLPLYMEHVLKYQIQENGILSSLPFIVLLFVNPFSGFLADFLISHNILSIKNSRKLMNSIGLFIPSFLMVGVCFSDAHRGLTIALLTLAVGFTGFTMAGYTVNHLDIFPPFAGLSYGLSNSLGTTTGIIGPAVVSALTDKHNTPPQWKIFFFITAGIFFIGGLVFLLLAQGESQPWVQPYIREVVNRRSADLIRRRSRSSNNNNNDYYNIQEPPEDIGEDYYNYTDDDRIRKPDDSDNNNSIIRYHYDRRRLNNSRNFGSSRSSSHGYVKITDSTQSVEGGRIGGGRDNKKRANSLQKHYGSFRE